MVGMRKNGKRLLISPPSFAYGADGKPGSKVTASSVVLFELEIVRVSFVGFLIFALGADRRSAVNTLWSVSAWLLA